MLARRCSQAALSRRGSRDVSTLHNRGRVGRGGRESASLWTVGLAIMILSEACTLARIEPFASWNTPICWTGFIIFADALVYRVRGESWIRSAPQAFAFL